MSYKGNKKKRTITSLGCRSGLTNIVKIEIAKSIKPVEIVENIGAEAELSIDNSNVCEKDI